MFDEPDVWQAARTLVEKHGRNAADHVAMRIAEMALAKDADGQRFWENVWIAVHGIVPDAGAPDTVH